MVSFAFSLPVVAGVGALLVSLDARDDGWALMGRWLAFTGACSAGYVLAASLFVGVLGGEPYEGGGAWIVIGLIAALVASVFGVGFAREISLELGSQGENATVLTTTETESTGAE